MSPICHETRSDPAFTIILLIAAMAGCATQKRAPDPAPAIEVSDSVWWQVDRDIAVESQAANVTTKSFARRQMERWRLLVTQRAEADFIPWFSSYWTRQWLTAKVGWHRLAVEDGAEHPVGRMAAYLQAQYHDRVLAPVASEVDPASVMAQETKLYIQSLGGQLQTIPRRRRRSSVFPWCRRCWRVPA